MSGPSPCLPFVAIGPALTGPGPIPAGPVPAGGGPASTLTVRQLCGCVSYIRTATVTPAAAVSAATAQIAVVRP